MTLREREKERKTEEEDARELKQLLPRHCHASTGAGGFFCFV